MTAQPAVQVSTAETNPARTFPFSPADEIGAYFDLPEEPNNLHAEVHLYGRLDEARLREAVLGALAARPRACVRRVAARPMDRRFQWEVVAPDLDPLTAGHWDNAHELSRERTDFLAVAPCLDLAPPVRVRLSRGPESDVLLLNAHHSAMDGVSCLQLIKAIAWRYGVGHELEEDPVPAPPPTPYDTPPGKNASPLLVRPARIAPRTKTSSPGYGYRLACLARPSRQARDRLDPDATVNDILVATFGLAIARWNAACGRPTGTVQVTMPVNTRGQGPGEFGNRSRLAAIAISPYDRADPHRLITGVAAQTRAAKRHSGSPIGMMGSVLAPGWLPIAAKQRLAGPLRRLCTPFIDTAKLSNWGVFAEPPRFGPAGPARAVWTSGPGPMPRGLSLTILTVADRLHLVLRYRRALLDAGAADAFVDTYLGAYDDLLSGGAQ